MVDRSRNRSDSYQWFLIESPYSPEMLTEFSDSQGLTGAVHNEELLDLQEQLIKAFWRIVDTQLTSRQREVLHLSAEGKTQIEIAKLLHLNQRSITKSINGNTDYRNKNKRIYGGAKKKIMRLAEKDLEIQNIFRRMAELREDY